MIYNKFIQKTKDYLKSVRILKDYISIDLIFKNTWVITNEHKKNIEIIKEGSFDDNKVVVSFVSKISEDEIDKLEMVIDSVIRFNVDREEKEKLFKTKVDELKSIFASQKLEDLKNLKFETLQEMEKFIENDERELTEGDREFTEREEEKSTSD